VPRIRGLAIAPSPALALDLESRQRRLSCYHQAVIFDPSAFILNVAMFNLAIDSKLRGSESSLFGR
jgi:hypothetical protein